MILVTLVVNGVGAFSTQVLRVSVYLDPERLGVSLRPDESELRAADFEGLAKNALAALFPDVEARTEKRQLAALLSSGAAYQLRDTLLAEPSALGETRTFDLPLSGDATLALATGLESEEAMRLSEAQRAWLARLQSDGRVRHVFNWSFLTSGNSREPELAGILAALTGSLWTMLATLALSLPVGVAAAVYLEEFAARNRVTDLLEVNINNLAAVPSIVFGLLGLAVFLNGFGLPRSAPVVGGMVLALMTLPTVIISSRAALASVPPSIREAAIAMGASPVQVVTHFVLPLAMPGILTGTIIGMARALGETAPLLMIGMVAFIVDVPRSPLDPATVLPVQIYLWADSPERAFEEKTSAAILILLAVLVAMNLSAVYLRRRMEKRW
jgi:phosphate transport system permease protein